MVRAVMLGLWNRGSESKAAKRRRIILEFAHYLHAADYTEVEKRLRPDMTMIDDRGSEIPDRTAFIAAMSEFNRIAKNPLMEITSMLDRGDEILARGFVRSQVPGIDSETFWKIAFKGNRIVRIEVARGDNQMTLPRFYRQYMTQFTAA